MKNNYITFEITLKNNTKCKVNYCKKYAYDKELNYRVDHFEFENNYYISETGYRSHFLNIEPNLTIDPEEIAIKIGNELIGIDERQQQIQQALI